MKNPKRTYGKAFLVTFLLIISIISKSAIPAISQNGDNIFVSLSLLVAAIFSVISGGLSMALFFAFCLLGFSTPPSAHAIFFYFWVAITFSLGMFYVAAEKQTATQ